MTKKWVCGAFAVLFVVGSTGIVTGQDKEDALRVRVEAFLVSRTEEGLEELIKVETVEPGQMLEFILTYRNTSEWPIRNVNAVAPIPRPGVYVGGSATIGHGLSCSIDGGHSYASEPIRYTKTLADGSEREAIASPGAYTHLRWRLRRVKPHGAVVLRYRTRIPGGSG